MTLDVTVGDDADTRAVDGETFAAYLARFMCAQRGFHRIVPPEAEALVPACDVVLVRPDPTLFQIACIVDREAHPERVFQLPPELVQAVAQACRRRIRFRKAPALVTIYEVGPGATGDETMRRLAAYRSAGGFSQAIVGAVGVDPERRDVKSARGLLRRVGYRWLQALLRAPRIRDLEPPPAVAAARGFPFVTAAILAVLVAVFAGEVRFGIDDWSGALKPSIRTLLAFGGVSRILVQENGEWWRMATAPLLHADAFHIVFNGIALLLVGRLAERLMGPAWFAATFAVSALCGSALSIAVNAPNLLSVGASGAIVGLFAATSVLSFHIPAGPVRSVLQVRTVQTLIPALVPIFSAGNHANIDYGAHFGGAAGGFVMGLVMLAVWPKALPRPRFARVAGAVAVAGALLVGAAVVPDLVNYRKVPLYAELFQPWPATDAEARALAYDIVTAKPRDPRGHFVEGLTLISARDLPGAEAELRKALADPEMLTLLQPGYSDRIRLVLAAVLLDEKAPDEARTVMAPACGAEKTGGPMSADIARMKLCP